MPGRTERLVLPPEPQSVGTARRFTRQICSEAQLDPELCANAILLTSETVTNAIIHGRSEVRLAVTIEEQRIRVEVGDDNSRHPVLQAEDHEALDGRGLALVQATATAWGVGTVSYGKIVWFELHAGANPQ